MIIDRNKYKEKEITVDWKVKPSEGKNKEKEIKKGETKYKKIVNIIVYNWYK